MDYKDLGISIDENKCECVVWGSGKYRGEGRQCYSKKYNNTLYCKKHENIENRECGTIYNIIEKPIIGTKKVPHTWKIHKNNNKNKETSDNESVSSEVISDTSSIEDIMSCDSNTNSDTENIELELSDSVEEENCDEKEVEDVIENMICDIENEDKKGKEVLELMEKLKNINKDNDINEEIDKCMKTNHKLKYIDLFCGIGSFHESFKHKKWKCIMASDLDESTHEVYYKNHGILPMGDIYDIDEKTIEKCDILCAGFPCQSFSQVGNHKGLDDKRGVLFLEIIRFIKYHKPKIIALENVQALLNHDKGNTFNIISESIKKEGYNIEKKVLKCSDYGIPQMRKRLIIICVREDIKHNINIFDLKKYEKDVIMKEYLNKNFEKKYAYTIRCGGKGSPINDRHNWDGYWVDGEEYRLTIDDAKKLQGFNDNFIMSDNHKDAWRHLGNTIPTIFTKIIADKIEQII